MHVEEVASYSREYLEPDKRSIANAIQITFTDGSQTDRVEIHFPLGHRRRRAEALPVLKDKFMTNVHTRFPKYRAQAICGLFDMDIEEFGSMAVTDFMGMLVL
jgi:2-methylcitrate dehydratase